MQNKTTFSASPRDVQGKKVKKLRMDGQVPANIISPNHDSVMISVDQSNFRRLYSKIGDTGLVYLSIEGEKGERPVLVEDVVTHPLTGVPEHVVFRQVNLKEKISAEVPVEIVGESAVKDAVLITVVNAVTVEALPTDLPEKFEVDVSVLTEIGQSITLADLNYDRNKVSLVLGEQDETSPVVILQEVKEEVAEEVVAPAEGESDAQPQGGGETQTEQKTEEAA